MNLASMRCAGGVPWTRVVGISSVVVVLGMAGCNDSGMPTVPVRGTVTFAGGLPPKPGSIAFAPIEVTEGLPHRPGVANFSTNGEFEVTSYRENDGLIPGTYQPSVDCWLQNPNPSDPSTFERFNAVPKGFNPPPITVDAEASVVEVVIDIPPKQK
jgi:hypothetical protein